MLTAISPVTDDVSKPDVVSTVINTKTGDVIADVKQDVKQDDIGGEQEPETVVETKIDVPSSGVHRTFVEVSFPVSHIYIIVFSVLNRNGRFRSKAFQIVPKWEKNLILFLIKFV